MLSIKKLLLPLLIASTVVAPVCYANPNTHQTMPDEQLKNRLHQILWSHKDAFNLKDPNTNRYDLFDQQKRFILEHPCYKSLLSMLTDYYPNYYAQFFNTKGSNYLVYKGYQQENGKGGHFEIYARVPEQPNMPILFVKLAEEYLEGYRGYEQWGAQWISGYKVSFAEFSPISNTMSDITHPLFISTSMLSSSTETACTYEQEKPRPTEQNTAIIHDTWDEYSW